MTDHTRLTFGCAESSSHMKTLLACILPTNLGLENRTKAPDYSQAAVGLVSLPCASTNDTICTKSHHASDNSHQDRYGSIEISMMLLKNLATLIDTRI